jgi:hypothetical protein
MWQAYPQEAGLPRCVMRTRVLGDERHPRSQQPFAVLKHPVEDRGMSTVPVDASGIDVAELALRRAGLRPARDGDVLHFEFAEIGWSIVAGDEHTLQLLLPVGPAADFADALLLDFASVESEDDTFLLAPMVVRDEEDPADEPWLFFVGEWPAAAASTVLEAVRGCSDTASAVVEALVPAPSTFAFKSALATLRTAQAVCNLESSVEHQRRMTAAIEEKQALILDAFGDYVGDSDRALQAEVVDRLLFDDQLPDLPSGWGVRLLIDQCFGDPFAPYDIQVSDVRLDEGRAVTGQAIFGADDQVEQIIRSAHLEASRHSQVRNVSPVKLGVATAGMIAVAVASHGAALASLASGSTATGAAATAHGLAVLGGGTANFGMAGGAAVLKATTAVGMRAAATGIAPLLDMGGLPTLTIELARLQTQAIWVLDADEWAAAKTDLLEQRQELLRQLEREERICDPAGRRLKEHRESLRAIDRAIESVESDSYDLRDVAALGVQRGVKVAGHKWRRIKDHWRDL